MTGAAVEVRGLTHRFRTREGVLTVLDRVTFTMEAGSYVALTGVSGAGKSTLLGLLGGLETPQEGGIAVLGRELGALRGDRLAAYRREVVGFVFQHFGLLDALTATENVELAGTLARLSRPARRRRAVALLEAVGLADRGSHRPGELSGGERQRVAIARALMNEPRLLLADEPTGNLDDDSTERVVTLLESLPHEHGCTLVLVTHDRVLTRRAERTLVLHEGELHEASA